MKKVITKVLFFGVMAILACGFFQATDSYAEEGNSTPVGTSISLTPVSKILQISANSVYDNNFEVENGGDAAIRVEVYAAPYSYIYSEEEDSYHLGFSNENNYTQISRWISFKDSNGSYVKKAVFSIEPKSKIEVSYRISTPSSIPNGGQYAVIFAHTLSSSNNVSGIRTEASPGMIIYGRSIDGESQISAEVRDLEIKQSVTEGTTTRNNIYASAKVKNTGNVDFSAVGKLKVEAIPFGASYETPATGANGKLSVIPETELVLSDEWTETPSFGLYKVTWTVTAGEVTESIERVVFLFPPVAIIITIILLTILIVWIIIVVRKRKARRSGLAV